VGLSFPQNTTSKNGPNPVAEESARELAHIDSISGHSQEVVDARDEEQTHHTSGGRFMGKDGSLPAGLFDRTGTQDGGEAFRRVAESSSLGSMAGS